MRKIRNWLNDRIWPWVLITFGSIFLLELWHQPFVDTYVNPVIWVAGNVILAYFFVALAFYVVLYGVKFNWRWIIVRDENGVELSRTPNFAGRLILAFTSSLLALASIVVIGTFVNPISPWFVYPNLDIYFWRPTLRLLVFVGVAVTTTALGTSLIRRIRRSQSLNVEVSPKENTRR